MISRDWPDMMYSDSCPHLEHYQDEKGLTKCSACGAVKMTRRFYEVAREFHEQWMRDHG